MNAVLLGSKLENMLLLLIFIIAPSQNKDFAEEQCFLNCSARFLKSELKQCFLSMKTIHWINMPNNQEIAN